MKKCLCLFPILFTTFLYGQSTDSLRYVDSLNAKAGRYYQQSLDSCMKYARVALDISDRIGYARGQAAALNNMGIYYNLSNDQSLAFQYYSDALRLSQGLGDSATVVKLLMNIGLTLDDKGDDKRARSYFWAAMDKGRRLSKDSVVSLLLINYINVFMDSLSKDSISIYLTRAKLIAGRYHDRRDILDVGEIEGRMDLAQGLRAGGLARLKAVAAQAGGMDENYMEASVLDELGDDYIHTNPDSAIDYYQRGLAVAQKKGFQSDIKWTALKLYRYYHDKGDQPRALSYADEALNIYGAQDSTSNKSGVTYMDYAIAREQLATTEARSKNRKLTILVLSVVSVSAVAIAVFFFLLNRLKGKHTRTLEALNSAIGQRNDELQQRNEFNGKLVSLLAHDFRQPIVTAKNLAILLRDPDDFTPEEIQRIVVSIETSSDTAIDIFENILQWIKRQLLGFTYEPVSLELQPLVHDAMRPFIASGLAQPDTLVNAVPPGLRIDADKELLQFINRNLIHNALKFSPEGGRVTVSASSGPGGTTVCIQDEGKGISPQKLPGLFDFKKELTYDNDKEKGAGVALMICKDFIDRMKGRIWAENAPGGGAVFCYTLP